LWLESVERSDGRTGFSICSRYVISRTSDTERRMAGPVKEDQVYNVCISKAYLVLLAEFGKKGEHKENRT